MKQQSASQERKLESSQGGLSEASKNTYRALINNLNMRKTILDQYYSGPPKFETQVDILSKDGMKKQT